MILIKIDTITFQPFSCKGKMSVKLHVLVTVVIIRRALKIAGSGGWQVVSSSVNEVEALDPAWGPATKKLQPGRSHLTFGFTLLVSKQRSR